MAVVCRAAAEPDRPTETEPARADGPRVSEEADTMATDAVRVKLTRYLGGIPGQERRNSGNGTLHLGPGSLYVTKPTDLGVTVLGVKYGKVDLDKVSSIGIGTMTPPDRVAITVHLKDGSAGSYEVKRQSQQTVLELLQPVAAQLDIPISEEPAGAGV
jgi:hypothetical protein